MQIPRLSRRGGRATHWGLALVIAAAAIAATFALAQPLLDTPGVASTGDVAAKSGSAVPSYKSEVVPILTRYCFRCHGPDRADKGLRLDSYRRIMAGDSYGAILIPGDSSLSAMVSVIRNGTMPHDSTKLPPAEIDALARWIDAGAPQN